MTKSVYQRRMAFTLLFMAVCAPFIAYFGLEAMRTIRTSPSKWVPATFQKRIEYDWFEKTFETNDSVIISWDGCTLDDPRLEELYQTLHEPPDSPQGDMLRQYIQRVFTGKTLLESMMDYPLELSEETARTRLSEVLIGPDGKTTCCVVLLTEGGGDERKKSVPLLMELAEEKTGLPREELHFVGPIMDAYAIDVESVKSLRTFLVPSFFIVLTLCRVCLRSWVYTFLVFGIAIFGELTTLALVYGGDRLFDFGPMNAVLIVMPPLVMVLTVSAAVHLVNYYHDEVRRSGFEDAPRKALKNGMMPCVLATTTTAIGLLSLMLSDIIPVKLFGVYATCGLVTTLTLLLLTLPGAQERWPVAPREGRESIFKDLSGISNFVCRYPIPLSLAGLLLMACCGWGLQYMHTSVNVRSLFTPDSRILIDYRWFENNIGPMTPVEVVLHFDKESGLDEVERLEIVDDIHRSMAEIDEIHGTMSASTFFPSIPRSFAQRRATAIRLRRTVQAFDDINYTAIFDHFVTLAPGESLRFADIAPAEGETLTVEGWTGNPQKPDDVEGWSTTTWEERRHFAYVFHGGQVRKYLDGKRVSETENAPVPSVARDGARDVVIANDQSEQLLAIDAVRFSDTARYWYEFKPPARVDRDTETVALFRFAQVEGNTVSDESGRFFVELKPSQKTKRRLPDQAWRIGGRVAALGEIDYGEFLAEIQQQIDPRLWAVHYMRDIREMFQGISRRELADKQLLLVGAPPRALADAKRLNEDEPRDETSQQYGTSEEKTAAIFTDQLVKLLVKRGFSPDKMQALQGDDVPPGGLAAADLVIFVRDVPGISYADTAKTTENVLDARTHPVMTADDHAARTGVKSWIRESVSSLWNSIAGQTSAEEKKYEQPLVTATYTGVMPLAYEVQNALLNDLIWSFVAAVALVSVVMILLQRSPIAGVVAMLPNVFPMTVLFGVTSGLGMAIDIGTVMTASVALGIAVDDTLHFLTWFNREHAETGDNIAGVKLAFRHCAKAMLQTTLICSLGLAVYSLSWFMPTRRFSWMMVSLLMAAVIGDLVFLPAILAGPIGKLFPQRKLIGDPLAKKTPAKPPVEEAPPNAKSA